MHLAFELPVEMAEIVKTIVEGDVGNSFSAFRQGLASGVDAYHGDVFKRGNLEQRFEAAFELADGQADDEEL